MSVRRFSASWFTGTTTLALVATMSSAAIARSQDMSGAAFQQRSVGLGDPYYPNDGNPGYDVQDYNVTLTYDPDRRSIKATTIMTAIAKEDLTQFNLDFTGMTISSLLVNDQSATFTRPDSHELVVKPKAKLATGSSFQVKTTYSGVLSSSMAHYGSNGAITIASEPHSCIYWYPCNDHPTDKSTFHLNATVPDPLVVVGNGVDTPPVATKDERGRAAKTYQWALKMPTSTFLTMMSIERFTVKRSTLPNGVPVIDAYGPGTTGMAKDEGRLPEILAALGKRFGPYPWPAAGSVFLPQRVGFSLETASRPVYQSNIGIATIAHENGHQWWGDHVGFKQWKDICVAECFASYSQWLWDEANGANLDTRYRNGVSGVTWSARLYDMGAGKEFTWAGVYSKGIYFLHALRMKVGDAKFFATLQAVQTKYGGGNISMPELRNEIAASTGVNLDKFWAEWTGSTKPSQANLLPARP